MNIHFHKLPALMAGLALLLSACGGPAPTSAPAPSAADRPTVAAEQPAANVPTPTSASAPTEASTATPALQTTGDRSATVTALWYAASGGQAIGGSSPVRITVQPTGGTEVRVGFFENEVGGSGGQWRASDWMATVIATLLGVSDLDGKQISFEVDGKIDGPSAGALMTIGLLAALRGKAVRDDAAMIGTINPDGTIGPV